MNTHGQSMVAYWTPKQDTDPSDWEDGAAYSCASGWFAVTDGASTGSNSREWAYTLAESFVRETDSRAFQPAGFVEWLTDVRAKFDPNSSAFPSSNVPQWVRQVGAQQGAFATLVGGRISGDRLDAIAVGDCCLFHVAVESLYEEGRPDHLPMSFPLVDPAQFGTSPMLVSSTSGNERSLTENIRHLSIRVRPGDVVFAATDALAQTMLQNLGRPDFWRLLTGVGHRGFAVLCRDLRATGQLKNDDVTLFRALVPEPGGGR